MQRDIDILLAHRETLFPGALQDHAWPRVFLGQALLEQDVQLECSARVSSAGTVRSRPCMGFVEPGRQEALFVQHFGSRVGEAMTEASNIWLAWKTDPTDPFVYFVDADAARFVERLGLTGVDPALTRYQGIPAYIFGAQLPALKAGVLSDYNLYYMLGR